MARDMCIPYTSSEGTLSKSIQTFIFKLISIQLPSLGGKTYDTEKKY